MKALLIIDMLQKDLPSLYSHKKLIQNQLRLMRAFKKSGNFVILAGGWKNGRSPRNTKQKTNPVMQHLWGDETKGKNNKPLPPEQLSVAKELLVEHYDLYIRKSEYSAFYKTRLENYLRKKKVDTLYLAGIYLGCCVYFTGADAAMRAIQPIAISDAVSSPSPERTRMNLENFRVFMGPTMTTNQVIKSLGVVV